MDFIERFLKYVSYDTTSYEPKEEEASSPNQYELGKFIVNELKELKADEISINKFGTVYGYFKGEGEPIALIAHLDTSSSASGKDIKPRIIENYDGENIKLNEDTIMKTEDFPLLKESKGHKLIVTDGTTLLGADDKAGVAIAMELVSYFVKNNIKHRSIEVVFSTDEEIGVGADHIFLEDLKSKYGYTLDGGDIRAINIENFNAASMKLEIKGRSIHPGDAKDKMINAINVGIDFHNSLPTYLRPEHTTLREGFYHLNAIKGNEEFCELFYIVREHDLNKLNTMLDIARLSVKRINESYKDEICKLTIVQGYRNMKEKIDENKFVVDNIVNIYKEMNIPFVFFPIRGGTDGASLTNRGYPCPNLGTGGANFHGRFEYLDVDQALTMVEILKRLFKIAC